MEFNENLYPLFSGGTHSCRRRCGACDASASCSEETCAMTGACTSGRDPLAGCSLAMVYCPEQAFDNLYEPEEGLTRGTVFVALDMPFEGDGRCR